MIIQDSTKKIIAACPVPAYGNMVYYDRDFEIDKLYKQNPLISDYSTDWSKIDASMCVPGTEYHKTPEDGITRPIFSGFVYGVPQGIPTQDILGKNLMAISNYRFITDLVFQPGEVGKIQSQHHPL